jgi:hypothetical protein
LVLPLCAAIVLIAFSRSPRLKGLTNPARMSVAVLIFYLPSAAWIARNYWAMGAFPLFASQQGDTVYGCYNPVTAAMGPRFAVWIAPWRVTGVQGWMAVVSEAESDRLLREAGMRFIRTHWRRVPAMMFGHLVRALLPERESLVKPLVYPEWICRLGLYAAALLAWIARKPSTLPPWYGLLLGATILTVATTVIFFFFDQRYVYPLFVLLMPFAASSRPLRMLTGRYQTVSATVSSPAYHDRLPA